MSRSRDQLFSANVRKTIDVIERNLFDFYQMDQTSTAFDHLVRKEELPTVVPEAADKISSLRGSLVSVSDSEETFLGLYLSEEIVRLIDSHPCHEQLHAANLDSFCVLVEEISHFHLMINRINRLATVSQLELEWQGEVDKVLVPAALLNDQARDPHFRQLFTLVYEASHLLQNENIERYKEASHQAAKFWMQILRRFEQPFHRRNIDDFKDILRLGYRRNWQGKVSLMNEMNRTAA